MSVRFGMVRVAYCLGYAMRVTFSAQKPLSSLRAFHQVNKSMKKIIGVVGPRRGFWMILHRKKRIVFMRQPFHCFVVQIDMGDLRSALQRVNVYTKPMVLCSDLYFLGRQIHHW